MEEFRVFKFVKVNSYDENKFYEVLDVRKGIVQFCLGNVQFV